MKYADEVRLGVGVSIVQLPSGIAEGLREKSFNCSGKVILSNKDYLARRRREIKRVKGLKCGAAWIVDN